MNKKHKIILIIILAVIIFFSIVFVLMRNEINKNTDIEFNKHGNMIEFEEFSKVFNNTINYQNSNVSYVHKIDASKDIIYSNSANEKKNGAYDININIPSLNINSEEAKKINQEITDIFYSKAGDIKKSINVQEGETIYTVDYAAYVSDNILSIAIKSTLKENNSAQRIIIKTYTYNLASNEQITLKEMLTIKNININSVQKIITNEIKEKHKEIEELQQIGYSVYKRDSNSSIYNIKNSNYYLLGENDKIYVIYPYGNTNFTSETDIILIN